MSHESASELILGMPIVSFPCVLLSLLGWGRSSGAALLFGDSGSLENEPCLARNGLIHHLVADRTYTLTVHDEDLTRFGYLRFAWSIDRVDSGNLSWVDCAFAAKSKACRCFCLSLETLRVRNIEVRRVQSRDSGGCT